jgi:dynein heavy chain
MLTAMKQEVCRKHQKESWSLDDIVYHTEVTNYDNAANVKSPPGHPNEGGCYVHGLSLEG